MLLSNGSSCGKEGRTAGRKEAGGAKTQSGEKIGDDGFDHQSLLPYSITEIPNSVLPNKMEQAFIGNFCSILHSRLFFKLPLFAGGG